MNTHVLGAGQFVEFILTHERNETYCEDEEFSFKYIESITYIGYFVMFAKSYMPVFTLVVFLVVSQIVFRILNVDGVLLMLTEIYPEMTR